jgi:hypothetical protein
MKNQISPSPIGLESMVDARQACVSLRLPHYWFSDPAMRAKYRIPHYLIGGLVRYRMSELHTWAASTQAVKAHDPCRDLGEPDFGQPDFGQPDYSQPDTGVPHA